MIQQATKRYQPPAPRWVPVVRNGRLLFRLDPVRGLIELKYYKTDEVIIVDLAAEVEKHEQQATKEAA